MRRFILNTLMYIPFMTILFSCGKEDIFEPINNYEYFPNETGYQWYYQIENEQITYDVAVTIIGDSLIGDIDFKVWEYVYIDEDTSYHTGNYQFVNIQNDSIHIYGYPEMQIIIQPYEVGNWWVSPQNLYDTTYVIDKEDLMIGNNYYENVYKLRRTFNHSIFSYSYDYWIKPNVGILQMNEKVTFSDPNMVAQQNTWKLIAHKFE